MKKQSIHYGLSFCAALLTGITTAIIASSVNTNADEAKTTSTITAAASSLVAPTTQKFDGKNETVYAIADYAGTIDNVFIGSRLYTGEDALPFSLRISYYLDGEELPAKELAGKSGHIKIVYNLSSAATFQDKQIPFIAATGLTLDSAKFSNVKVSNGKIISEGESYLIMGYSLPGLSEDLAAEFIPHSFSVEADTSNFMLGTTYTILLNDLIAELDTSRLSDIDGLVNSVNQLASGLNQIIAGSSQLSDGAFKLASGARALQSGATELSTGMDALVSGSERLSDGLNQLDAFDSEAIAKIEEITTTVTEIIQSMIENYHLDPDSEFLNSLNTKIGAYYNVAYDAITTYTGNVKALASGAAELTAGATRLADGTHQLKSGIDQLVTGADQLAAGSQTLQSGLSTFKTTGIDRIVSFANHDMASFTRNARATVAAASSYRRFGDNTTAESVKFIIKTPSI